MEESVFFNLGNALASSKDTKELMRTMQIEQNKREKRGRFVIVEDEKNNEKLLFELPEILPSTKGKEFKVKEFFE
jgi:hypothetical protein